MAEPRKFTGDPRQLLRDPGKILWDRGQVVDNPGKSRGTQAGSRVICADSRVTCKESRVNLVLAPPSLARESHAEQWCAIQLPVRTPEPGRLVEFVHAIDALRRLSWAA